MLAHCQLMILRRSFSLCPSAFPHRHYFFLFFCLPSLPVGAGFRPLLSQLLAVWQKLKPENLHGWFHAFGGTFNKRPCACAGFLHLLSLDVTCNVLRWMMNLFGRGGAVGWGGSGALITFVVFGGWCISLDGGWCVVSCTQPWCSSVDTLVTMMCVVPMIFLTIWCVTCSMREI